MIESLRIENLRGIRSGVVTKLAAINVVVGPNNSGKSTLLEGFLLLVAPVNPASALGALLGRGGEALVAARQIAGDSSEPVQVTARLCAPTMEGELTTSLRIATPRDGQVIESARAQGFDEPMLELRLQSRLDAPASVYSLGIVVGQTGKVAVPSVLGGQQFPLPNVGYLSLLAPQDLETEISRIGSAGGLADVTRALGTSLPGLSDLRIQKLGDKFVTHAYFGGKPPIPAYLLGDGAKRLIEIAAMVFAQPNDTVLLEEPEAFQHPRYVREIVTMITTFAARGAQYVLTTHSIELVDLLLAEMEARGDSAPSLAIHRTKLVDGELRVTTLDAATARRLRDDLLEDLRG